MQYNFLIIILLVAAIFVIAKSVRYRRRYKNLFSDFDEKKIIDCWAPYSSVVELSQYESMWLKISNNLNCPEGKMLNNLRVSELKSSYPFPEMLIDDLLDEVSVNVEVKDDDYLSVLIARILSVEK